MRSAATIFLVLVFGCTTATAPEPKPSSSFKNVQVLPQTMSRQELIATMKSFTRGLGVRCNHCHVVTATEPKEEFDFPSDAKEEKRVARVMIQMAQQIDGAWMKRVADAEGEAMEREPGEHRVWCWTCHRGKPLPEAPPPPPAPGEPGK